MVDFKFAGLAAGAAALLSLAVTGSGRASVLSDTFANAGLGFSSGPSQVLLNSPAAESFMTDATGVLNEVEFGVSTSTNTGSLIVTLWTNAGGLPGTQIATLATISTSTIRSVLGSNTPGLIELYNVAPVAKNLVANTTYWIEYTQGIATKVYSVVPNSGTVAAADYANGAGLYEKGGTAVTNGAFGPWLEQCTSSTSDCNAQVAADGFAVANLSVNAPEPASIAILSSALAGLGVLRRRRRTGRASV